MNEGSSLAASLGTQTTAQPSSEPAPSPGASPAPNSQPAGGDQPVDMAKIFGEDFAKDPNLAKFKTPQDVAKSYKELQAMASKPRFDVPTAETPPEQAAEFYKKMGVPDAPDAYGLKPDAYRPEGNNESNAEFLKAFSTVAHEAKLTPTQAQAVHKFMDDISANVDKSLLASQAADDAKLDEMFTKALGAEKDTAVARIEQLIKDVVPEEMKSLISGKFSNEANLMLTLIDKHYRTKYGQSDNNMGDPGNNSGKTSADLRSQASQLMASPAYRNPMDPGHKSVKDQVDSLYKTIGELTNAAQRK